MVPCTPAGVMELLREAEVELEGAKAVVVGRSILVGKPLAQLLLAANATVTHCHSRTRDLAAVCREADVLVAAAGKPGLITADMVREGAVVIDVGTNRTDAGLVGDVDFEGVRDQGAGDHPGARRSGPDDPGDAPGEHRRRRAGPAGRGQLRLGRRGTLRRWTCGDCARARSSSPSRASCSSCPCSCPGTDGRR